MEAAKRVKRYSRKVLVGRAGDFCELEGARFSGSEEVALAYWLEGSGYPLVHGFLFGRGATPRGEYAILESGGDGAPGRRDPMGTRGLWKSGTGRKAVSFASDYRLLGEGATLQRPPRQRRQTKALGSVAFGEAASRLAALIEESVKARVRGQERVAVSFSGGLDSSLLALVAARHTNVVLCSAHAAGSRDETQAARAARLLDLDLETEVLDESSAKSTLRRAILPPGEATLMDHALWCIYSATSSLAEGRGATTILLGQLADELFGGYLKYAVRAREDGPAAAEQMMEADVRGCADRGFLRDEAACSEHCEVRFPYADLAIASFAEALPLHFKIRDDERKAVLRAAALELGLPEELAAAPKKAAQFSSGAAKLFGRL